MAVGFSDYGELRNADLCVTWVNWKGQHHLEDVHTSKNFTMLLDEMQDCRDFEYQEFPNGLFSFKYERALKPCHSEEDYSIDDGTVHVVWARGPGSLYEVNGLNISDEGIAESVDLDEEDPEERRIGINFTHSMDVSSDDTTYWCSSIGFILGSLRRSII
ncbi:Tyramine betahydroxylaselike [Caligus rogercresseyi]|uniref:Tyramine betahydroxylaselike n=1 Tax=Caligus rogercresseyi TaxID=217165 RepID=A0A7T8KHR8_CALRO|nr:Tyramine betahydroxylaselike [Caligus rogercresseyi]